MPRYGSETTRRLRRSAFAYVFVACAGATLANTTSSQAVTAFGLGLVAPGAGFLNWAPATSPDQGLAIALAIMSLSLFLVSVMLWFATGNAVAPPFIWAAAAIAAALMPSSDVWANASWTLPACCLAISGVALARSALSLTDISPPVATEPTCFTQAGSADPTRENRESELDLEDLKLMRLLLDRALQPVNAFEGFDRRDQFQTAALRYQVNFISYALSACQAEHLPAFDGYLVDAQIGLAQKLQDYRLWKYWQIENLWGNLRLNADPIPHENIMFSGFLATQLALMQSSSGARCLDKIGALEFQHPRGMRFRYGLPEIIAVLKEGFQKAPFGLMPCEPNWIYPLCNAITATAIKANDGAQGSSDWAAIADRLEQSLNTEFTRTDGSLVPFRSSYTGIAGPRIGGAVMQAFPCLFLNTLLPDCAARHWERIAPQLSDDQYRRALWPIDVGNYGFSRASSYAATAAAATEIGDNQTRRRLLNALDADCPVVESAGAVHRPNASIWAHAVEFMARCGRRGTYRRMVEHPATPGVGPRLSTVPYPDVLVSQAIGDRDRLCFVLNAPKTQVRAPVEFSGLKPQCSYHLRGQTEHCMKSHHNGKICITLSIGSRSEFSLHPVGA